MREAAIVTLCHRDPEKAARLIAAAPEMLTAIKDYLAWGAMTGSDRDMFEGRFRSVVAAAEGDDQ